MPGKDNFGLAKSYRCISLRNFLGMVVENVAAMVVSAFIERRLEVSTQASMAAGRGAQRLMRPEAKSPRLRR